MFFNCSKDAFIMIRQVLNLSLSKHKSCLVYDTNTNPSTNNIHPLVAQCCVYDGYRQEKCSSCSFNVCGRDISFLLLRIRENWVISTNNWSCLLPYQYLASSNDCNVLIIPHIIYFILHTASKPLLLQFMSRKLCSKSTMNIINSNYPTSTPYTQSQTQLNPSLIVY